MKVRRSIGTETGDCQLNIRGISIERVFASLLPERCQSCAGPAGAGLCADCRAGIGRVGNPCGGCGLEQPVNPCPRPVQGWRIASMMAPFQYAFPLNRHIHAMKFRPSRHMGRALGQMLAEVLQHRPTTAAVDALIPVPLHRARLRERGFNQAFELARPVAAATGLPLLVRGIQRHAHTAPQSLLPAHGRYRNLRGAFRIHRRIEGMKVAIVDDVVTTGATVNSLAASLRTAGAAEVHAWALARIAPREFPAGVFRGNETPDLI